jgi:hypothetical protein
LRRFPVPRTRSFAWEGPPDWLLAVEFHAGHDVLAKLPDLLLYNSALFRRHGLRVRTLLVVLHRGADSPQLTGLYERGFPDEPFEVALRYRVLRVWQVAPQAWLSGGMGLVPLAPLGDLQTEDLPAIVVQMKQRLDQATPQRAAERAAELWSAAFILMGIRYERAIIETLLKGVANMKESVTYQAILEEGEAQGEAKEARKFLIMLGRNQYGEPSPEVLATLNSVADVTRLEELGVRLLKASSWEELVRMVRE